MKRSHSSSHLHVNLFLSNIILQNSDHLFISMLLCLIWMTLSLKGKIIATPEANSLTETTSGFDLVTALQFSLRRDPSAS